MGLELNHAIVRCTDRVAAAQFFADLIDAARPHASGPFAAVRVNDRLTLDFYDADVFAFGHFAFRGDPGARGDRRAAVWIGAVHARSNDQSSQWRPRRLCLGR